MPSTSHPTKPKPKRPRRDLEPEDVEMADEASEISLPPTVPQPVRDRKGKGREILPPPDRKGKGREVMTAPEALFELKDVGKYNHMQ